MNKKQKAEVNAFYEMYKKEKGEKVCNNCTNKKCYIVSLPESERKDCNEHHENYDWDMVFDCKNHNKWQGDENDKVGNNRGKICITRLNVLIAGKPRK